MEVRKRGIQGRKGKKREKGDGLYTNIEREEVTDRERGISKCEKDAEVASPLPRLFVSTMFCLNCSFLTTKINKFELSAAIVVYLPKTVYTISSKLACKILLPSENMFS